MTSAGPYVLDRQARGRADQIVDRLSADLRTAFPTMHGLSPSNSKYMRRLASAWPDRSSCLRLVGKIPWGHNQTLLDKLHAADLRE